MIRIGCSWVKFWNDLLYLFRFMVYCTSISLFAGVFLIKDQKVLLLHKKSGEWEVWTIPFFEATQGQYPQKMLISRCKDLLGIELESYNLVKTFVAHKLNEESKVSLGSFSSCILWDGEIVLNTAYQYDKFERFDYKELPENMTSDMKLIFQSRQNESWYLELPVDTM